MSQQGKRKTKHLLDFQARNQLGTPGAGAKIFLRGLHPPRACGLLYITKNKRFLAYFILFSKNRPRKPGSVPASPVTNLQCSIASIWRDLSAAWYL